MRGSAFEPTALPPTAFGRLRAGELTFGATHVFISDEYPDFGAVEPVTLGGSPVKMHLAVDDTDAFVARALEEGATLLRSVKLEFHGNSARRQ